MNECHKICNDWYIGMLASISSIIGLHASNTINNKIFEGCYIP